MEQRKNWPQHVSNFTNIETPEEAAGEISRAAATLHGEGDMEVTISVSRVQEDFGKTVHLLRTAEACLEMVDRRRKEEDVLWIEELKEELEELIDSYERGKRPMEVCGECHAHVSEKDIVETEHHALVCGSCAEDVREKGGNGGE